MALAISIRSIAIISKVVITKVTLSIVIVTARVFVPGKFSGKANIFG
jgi:hypothetical protein